MGKRRGYVERINGLLQPGESAGLMVLDLFAGCGGLSLGFEAAGFSTVGYEKVPAAAARLQSFPDWFVFEGSETEQFTQIGNAVPPLFAYHLAQSVRRALETPDHPLEKILAWNARIRSTIFDGVL